MPLSDDIEAWLDADDEQTVGSLIERFGTGSFAVLFVLFLFIPALPLPTGGISHVFEIAAALLALELLAGRDELWIPARWRDRRLSALNRPRARAVLLKRIRWVERHSRPRLEHLLERRTVRRGYGIAVLVLTIAAFLAPPFSGLDTLPALGVVVMSLGVLLGDAVIAAIGTAIGALGIALVVGLGHAVTKLF